MERSCATATLCELTPLNMDPHQATGVARPLQVLLVEDNPEAAELARISLMEDREDPFRVEWSANLIHAMNRLMEPGIDVVLLDLGLPELSGYRSYRAIEGAVSRTIPVVVLTSDDRANVRNLILELGASDYLLKGQSSSVQLRRALRTAVQRGWAGKSRDVTN